MLLASAQKNTDKVKEIASQLGFAYCGISKAEHLEEEEVHLTNWLQKGYHGKMQWMEGHFDKRVDPTKLVDGAKSVVSLLFNYYPEEKYDNEDYKISKYAYGDDYHHIIKHKLKTFLQHINTEIGEVGGRVFIDSAPVLDRAWAAKSGLGWIGKNTMLITKQEGSFYFIAELIIDLDLVADAPTTDHCGTCTACIDSCPTDAIVADKVVDSTKCISYLTIELKENIPVSFKGQMEGWAFGCDICQDVCPWNKFSHGHTESAFNPHPKLKELHQNDWEELTKEVFKDVFKKISCKACWIYEIKRKHPFFKRRKVLATVSRNIL